MEALSPRSTNQVLKPKVTMERKVLDKNAAAAGHAAQKPPAVKEHHAQPPPAIVTEPVEDGERYSTGAFLGKGGFAICYEGKLMRNGRVFAMKVVKSEMKQKKMAEKVRLQLVMNGYVSYTDGATVSNGAPDSFQDATPPYRSVPSCLQFSK